MCETRVLLVPNAASWPPLGNMAKKVEPLQRGMCWSCQEAPSSPGHLSVSTVESPLSMRSTTSLLPCLLTGQRVQQCLSQKPCALLVGKKPACTHAAACSAASHVLSPSNSSGLAPSRSTPSHPAAPPERPQRAAEPAAVDER